MHMHMSIEEHIGMGNQAYWASEDHVPGEALELDNREHGAPSRTGARQPQITSEPGLLRPLDAAVFLPYFDQMTFISYS